MRKPDLKHVRADIVARYARRFGVKPGADLAEQVSQISKLMSDTENLAHCDGCGGDSDLHLPECPFCGDTGTADEEAPVVGDDQPEPVQVKADRALQSVLGSEQQERDEMKKRRTKVQPPAKAPAKPLKRMKKTAKKASKPKSSKAEKKPKAAKPAKGKPKATEEQTEVVKPEAQAGSQFANVEMPAKLSKGIESVKQLALKGVECMWELGGELWDIYDQKLWLQMTYSDGKPVYSGFGKFVSAEFGMSAQHAFRLMDASHNFDKQTLAEVGISKLNLILRVPPEQRERLLKEAKRTPRSALEKEVAELAGYGPKQTGREPFSGTHSSQVNKPKKSDRLTVIRSAASFKVPLFQKGIAERAVEPDGAVGIERPSNGVEVHYKLASTAEGLELQVKIKRLD